MSTGSFRSLIKAQAYASVDCKRLSREGQSEFLNILKKVVPKITVENGMERTMRHANPGEVDNDRNLKAAAMILHVCELEAELEGKPAYT